MIGLPKNKVRIVGHKSQWKELYLSEAEEIHKALHGMDLQIEHVGSTSIPGLAAKPIIDIMVGVKTMQEADRCIPLLEQMGYTFKGEFGIPNRYFFIKEKTNQRTHHLHLVTLDSDFWQDLIAFRDYLLANPKVKRDYEKLKRKLAEAFPEQREKYTNSKTEFIREMLEKAKKEL
jgi:GrpB-like predicted nucleotidyltransferase (UPF0157 family)